MTGAFASPLTLLETKHFHITKSRGKNATSKINLFLAKGDENPLFMINKSGLEN